MNDENSHSLCYLDMTKYCVFLCELNRVENMPLENCQFFASDERKREAQESSLPLSQVLVAVRVTFSKEKNIHMIVYGPEKIVHELLSLKLTEVETLQGKYGEARIIEESLFKRIVAAGLKPPFEWICVEKFVDAPVN